MDEGPRMSIGTVDERLRGLVSEIDGDLAGNGCGRDMRLQKSGYAVSYVLSRKGRWRRSCPGERMELRIHPEHIQGYREPFDALPEEAKKEIEEASACKRLIDPDACGPGCRMGYTFLLDGRQYQGCRYTAFRLTLSGEDGPCMKRSFEEELRAGVDRE